MTKPKQKKLSVNDLVFLKSNEALTDSLTVAGYFEKQHFHVLRAIDNHTKNGLVKSRKLFHDATYTDAKGERRRMVLMNRQGFELLAMGFTGDKAVEWKLKYSDAFTAMENLLKEKATQAWLETRQQGKLTRRAETDVIQQLIDYARAQGSEHAQMLYLTYSKLAKKFAGIDSRDAATVFQLNNLSLMEHMILNTIQTGMMAGKHYKEIYQDCKRRLEAFSDIAYLEGGKMLAIN